MRLFISVSHLLVLLLFTTPASSDQPPLKLVRDTSTKMLMTLKEEETAIKQNPARLREIVTENVLPHFDFERMGRWTLGKYWRNASPQQREEFIKEFRALLVRSYGRALVDYADAEIVYLPFRMGDDETRVKVHTELSRPQNNSVKITYSLHSTANGWKVYDVAIEGVSLVTNYRSSFMNKVRQDGLDQLINQLAANNKKAGPT
ncbi:MAG: ABC transporter substrate-binding protein [Gammaproteobacteria bacterium]|nr:MAG: ABC transporter substrate-binding protein [Gammaproteobacteria bacterium]